MRNLIAVEEGLATKNLTPGKTVYGERTVEVAGAEYRMWNPRRSKLAAAIYKGLKELPIKDSEKVLYLGAASGTTASHISDIVPRGNVYCVEFSQRVFRKLLEICGDRMNMVPLLADASRPLEYAALVGECGFLYQDIAQPNQGEILLRNADAYLEKGGFVAMAVKARSIDVGEEPGRIFQREAALLREGGIEIQQVIDLAHYEKDHAMVTGRKRW
ncbi:MAG: fibrillarin-like rRNA/tRNA 2'-O-methyltransferase [Candidatus Hydrothermarchaeaceae archaeon]